MAGEACRCQRVHLGSKNTTLKCQMACCVSLSHLRNILGSYSKRLQWKTAAASEAETMQAFAGQQLADSRGSGNDNHNRESDGDKGSSPNHHEVLYEARTPVALSYLGKNMLLGKKC